MADIVLTLGAITFADLEIPAEIAWGGEQATNIHKLLGGARVIDALGADDMALSWSGYFYGSDASDRAQALDQMRRDGRQQTLAWGGLSYQVVIKSFKATFQRAYKLAYSISCEVVAASGLSPQTSKATLDDLAGGDMDAAAAQAAGIEDGAVAPAIAALQGAISAVQTAQGALQGASLNALAPAATAAAQATGVISGVLSDLDGATLSDAGSVGGVVAGQFAPTSIASFAAQADLISQQATLRQVGALVKRVATNIAQATG